MPNSFLGGLAGQSGWLHGDYERQRFMLEHMQREEAARAARQKEEERRAIFGDLLQTVPLAFYFVSEGEADLLKRVMAFATEQKFGAREKCRLLGIPWVARRVAAEDCSSTVAQVLKVLSPSTFAQTVPEKDVANWARLVSASGINSPWMAHNAVALIEAGGFSDAVSAADFVRRGPAYPRSKAPSTVLAESHLWHAAEARRMEVMRSDMWAYQRELIWNYDLGGRRIQREPSKKTVEYAFPLSLRVDDSHTLHILTNEKEFREEGEAMRHCVASYWSQAAGERLIIGSIQKSGKRVWTVEFDMAGAVIQVRGKRNERPDPAADRLARLAGAALAEAIRNPVEVPAAAFTVQKAKPKPFYQRINEAFCKSRVVTA